MKEPMAVRDARRNSDGSGSRSPLGLASLPPETRDERAASSRDILGSAESSRSTSSASWVNASSKLSSDAGGEGGSEDAALPRRGPRPAAARLRPDDAGTRPDASREEDERAARGAPSGRDVLTIGARQRSAPSRGWHPPRADARVRRQRHPAPRRAGLRPRATRRAPTSGETFSNAPDGSSSRCSSTLVVNSAPKSRVRSRFVRHGVLINHFSARASRRLSFPLRRRPRPLTQLRRRLRPPHSYRPPFLQPPP